MKFILIDDDEFNNVINRLAITYAIEGADIRSFTEPEDGLAYIESAYSGELDRTILFLDINMPTLTGWEFLDMYTGLSSTIKDQIAIYILSSSVDPRDEKKATANPYVRGFVSKPVDSGVVLDIMNKQLYQ